MINRGGSGRQRNALFLVTVTAFVRFVISADEAATFLLELKGAIASSKEDVQTDIKAEEELNDGWPSCHCSCRVT